jgi:hypothetical protein
MAAFLVTGNPGAGKSELAEELTRRGLSTIDPDHDTDLSCWEDKAGNHLRLADASRSPDREWLRSHGWIWSRSRLEELLVREDGPVFVCGIAANIDKVVDLFHAVFLLHIDDTTQEARLVAHDAAKPPGRSEAGRQEIRDGRAAFEAQLASLGAIVLDGAAPTPLVADSFSPSSPPSEDIAGRRPLPPGE